MISLRKSFDYSPKIFYSIWISLIKKDLKRWQTEKSINTINLLNRLAKNKKTEEFANIIKAFTIEKFPSSGNKKSLLFFI